MSKLETNPKLKIRIESGTSVTKSISFDDCPGPEEEIFWADDDGKSGYVLREGPNNNSKPFDLEERTAKFGEAIIAFAKNIPANSVNNRLISQLVGAGTSIGANYCEAADCVSKKDFKKSIGTCRKESKETRFFLRMIATAEPILKDEARKLWKEAKELNLIFGAIWRKP
jgi:four helix bundle protein